MVPEIIIEKPNYRMMFGGSFAWYQPETETIHIAENLKPRWLAILHEYGHWVLDYCPQWIHRRWAVDWWYDQIWERLGLSGFFKVNYDSLRKVK